MEKNNISQNNNVIKKMLTCCILMCLFMLSLCSSQAFAASRYKYVCTMENGDNYTIITENTDDGFKIIGSYSEIYSKIGTSYATGRSLYDLIATEYESTTTESSKKERAKELLKLLEIFVANRKNSSGAPTDAQIAINGDVIVSGSNGTIQYGQNGTNGKKYDVIIEEAKNDKKNPYYNKDGEHKRNKILYISERLDIFYTDYELIKEYENF